jgi:hypothetical protein
LIGLGVGIALAAVVITIGKTQSSGSRNTDEGATILAMLLAVAGTAFGALAGATKGS